MNSKLMMFLCWMYL